MENGKRRIKKSSKALVVSACVLAIALLSGCSNASSGGSVSLPQAFSHDSASQEAEPEAPQTTEKITTPAYTITIPDQWKDSYSYEIKSGDPESRSMPLGFAWHVQINFGPWYGFEVAAITDDWNLQGEFNSVEIGPSSSCPGWNVWVFGMDTVSYDELNEYARWVSTAGEENKQTPGHANGVNDYILPDSSTRVYSKHELEQLSTYDLFIARNEIYARHNRLFASQELTDYFASKSWYHGTIQPADFSESVLSNAERTNAHTMLEIEQSRNSPYL